MTKKAKGNSMPQLRMDMASRDWVIVAAKRFNRSKSFGGGEGASQKSDTTDCVFCNLKKEEVLFENQTAIVVLNKFPAVDHTFNTLNERIEGNMYQSMNAFGFHEVVIFKNHHKQLWQMAAKEIEDILKMYLQRYIFLMKQQYVYYISIFHNSGPLAGASISHPHSQIITTPLIDSDLKNALQTAKRYFAKNKRCVYCDMVVVEKSVGTRIVFENENFLAICPFASKTNFEIIITPKHHLSYFEKITEKELLDLSETFLFVFKKLNGVLRSPDYNFYLHTSPCDGPDSKNIEDPRQSRDKTYDYYHWHWTILPKTQTPAGFELGARIDIVTVKPEDAAEYLRN